MLAAIALSGALLLSREGGEAKPRALPSAPDSVTGRVGARDKILSSGGYNTFAGAWIDPTDGAVMTAFVNVTGPVAPPCTGAAAPARCDDRGFRGATHRFVLLESVDGGRNWSRRLPDEPLPGAIPHAYSGQPVVALREHDNGTRAGTLLRRVNGEDISVYPEFGGPSAAYLQRLEPGATRWAGRSIMLDPARFTYNISRIQRLRDGRTLVALGAFWNAPAGERLSTPGPIRAEWLLMTSTDEGRTWRNALATPPDIDETAPAGEWDAVELPNGDLLTVMRTTDRPGVRRQVILKRTDDTIITNTGEQTDGGFVMGSPRPTTPGFAQSEGPQHPDLLAIEHGPAAGGILHIADEAIHYTADRGSSWKRVAFNSDWTPHYYPNSVQAPNGDIFVFSHAGSDENYTAAADKPVYMDRVRLAADGARDVDRGQAVGDAG